MENLKSVYIVGDLTVDLTMEEYEETFNEEQRSKLEDGELIRWSDPDGEEHDVGLYIDLSKKERVLKEINNMISKIPLGSVDNFKRVSNILFKKLDIMNDNQIKDFYLSGSIVSRTKDGKDNRGFVVNSYTFSNTKQFLKLEDEIKLLCNEFNARFYLGVNIKHNPTVALDMIVALSQYIKSGHGDLSKLFISSTAKNTGVRDSRVWIIDVDEDFEKLIDVLESLDENSSFFDNYLGLIPTPNGLHILIKPHELDKKFMSGKIGDLKRNDMTVIYYNKGE